MATWFPDRKVLAGGIGGVATWAITLVLQHYHVPVPDPTILSGVVGIGLSYLVPPSAQDVVKRVNTDLLTLANAQGLPVVKPAK